ncbi:MAG TPA: ABC transporter permease [Chitinophaga sp.]|uniref:ABC transporter permease n=1 Tax=Chitinophaga sp. TaxID=1869181 RepID=UPI002F936411
MFKNYLKAAWRNLLKNKAHSFINITGLSVGMAVAMLIGLWIWDEVTFNQYHKNYDRIAVLKQNQLLNGSIDTWQSMPYPIGDALRNSYGNYFKHVVMSSWTQGHLLAVGDTRIMKLGNSMEPGALDLFSLKMLQGTYAALKDPYSIVLSASLAKTLFGDANPMDKLIKIDNKDELKVTGVYEDLPANTSLTSTTFFLPWEYKLITDKWIRENSNPWGSNGFQVFVELADHMDMTQVSQKIRNVRLDHQQPDERKYHSQIFLHPMRKWHLYEEFKQGVNTGGRIQFVWLFGIIGVFVLLLACINFMNLSTARSEKRAKEVGIRKAIGSFRMQLIWQFFGESLMMSVIAFVLCLVLVQLMLPFFNETADKNLGILWSSPLFWLAGIGCTVITGLVAGSYPALYLSSFQPVKVLKGTFRVGRLAAVPRKVLVVVQFTVSVVLIIGTIVVFRQVQFARNRPVGYNREGLISVDLMATGLAEHFEAIKQTLQSSGAVTEIAQAESPLTQVWNTNGGFDWKDKDPSLSVDFPTTGVSPEYGKTIGWQFKEGRDFSREFASDSAAFVLNESAVKFMGLKNPVGEIIKWDGISFHVIGVIKDMIVESPYAPVRPSVFCITRSPDNFFILRLNPAASATKALRKIEAVFKQYSPAAPFSYKFVDLEYARKFENEQRIGKLSSGFAILAIFISCLGLFGMATFMAEQRTKEIGIRKVMGASVLNVWGLLSKDFVMLVVIAMLIAAPLAYYGMYKWLQHYEYRSDIAWWIFAVTAAGAVIITLLTVSYQAIKAALMNPVKSLRSE